MVQNSAVADENLGGYSQAGGMRAYNLDGGNFFSGGSFVEWKAPRVVMTFGVTGGKRVAVRI